MTSQEHDSSGPRASLLTWLTLLIGVPGAVGALLIVARAPWWGPADEEVRTVGASCAAVALVGLVLLVRDLKRPAKRGLSCAALAGLIGVALFALLAHHVVLGDMKDRSGGNEVAAIGALKTLHTAQQIFREGDKEADGNLDYGSLSELTRVGLIDPLLGSGTKLGYLFEASYAPSTTEFLWFATASPALPSKTGAPHFVTNHEGVVFYTVPNPFAVDPQTCEIPAGALRVPR